MTVLPAACLTKSARAELMRLRKRCVWVYARRRRAAGRPAWEFVVNPCPPESGDWIVEHKKLEILGYRAVVGTGEPCVGRNGDEPSAKR